MGVELSVLGSLIGKVLVKGEGVGDFLKAKSSLPKVMKLKHQRLCGNKIPEK